MIKYMRTNNKDLYNKIMKNVSKELKHSLKEAFDSEGLYKVTWDIRKRYGRISKGLKFKKVESKFTTVADYRDALAIFKNIKYKYQSQDHDYYAEVLKIEKLYTDSASGEDKWEIQVDESGTYIGDDVLESRNNKKSQKKVNEVRGYSNTGEYPKNSVELARNIANTIILICKSEDDDDMFEQAIWLKSLIMDNLKSVRLKACTAGIGNALSTRFNDLYRSVSESLTESWSPDCEYFIQDSVTGEILGNYQADDIHDAIRNAYELNKQNKCHPYEGYIVINSNDDVVYSESNRIKINQGFSDNWYEYNEELYDKHRYHVWSDNQSIVSVNNYFDDLDDAHSWASWFVHLHDGKESDRVILHIEDTELDETVDTLENQNKCDY